MEAGLRGCGALNMSVSQGTWAGGLGGGRKPESLNPSGTPHSSFSPFWLQGLEMESEREKKENNQQNGTIRAPAPHLNT